MGFVQLELHQLPKVHILVRSVGVLWNSPGQRWPKSGTDGSTFQSVGGYTRRESGGSTQCGLRSVKGIREYKECGLRYLIVFPCLFLTWCASRSGGSGSRRDGLVTLGGEEGGTMAGRMAAAENAREALREVCLESRGAAKADRDRKRRKRMKGEEMASRPRGSREGPTDKGKGASTAADLV